MIHTHRWNPPASRSLKPVGIYLFHGTGEHAARYEPLATRLAAKGYRVAAHDHPGHGQSTGKRGVIDPPGSLVDHAAEQLESFAREIGSRPVLFGHSLGGVAAAELVLQRGISVAGLILSAPAFVPHMSWLDHVTLKVLGVLAPKFTLDIPYDASALTSDPEQQKIAYADPLLHGFKSASLIGWLVRSGKRSLDLAEKLDTDTLLLIAGADPVVDSSRTREFAVRAPGDRIVAQDYEGYLHELLNETPAQRERVMQDIESWLERFDH